MTKPAPRTLLVVDDSKEDVELLLEAFQECKLPTEIRIAADGREAIDYLGGEGRFSDRGQNPYPDLVLLDINMPRHDGFEVLEWMRASEARPRTTVVIMLTTSGEPKDITKAYRHGANSFVVKPSNFQALCGVVEDLRDYWLKHNHFANA